MTSSTGSNDSNDSNDSSNSVSFLETIEHLGGAPVLLGGVLLLFVAYTLLVEWLLPRRRTQTPAFARTRAAKKRK